MDLFFKLPQELINHIYEYNPEHRKKMYWVLHAIRETQFCEVCDKIIMKYVFSHRRGYEVCCSSECLARHQGCIYYYGKNKWWI
jgi:hypothetical protein